MITSADNRGWPGDVAVNNLAAAGLPVASVIRTTTIATIESADATKLGGISAAALRKVSQQIRKLTGPELSAEGRRH